MANPLDKSRSIAQMLASRPDLSRFLDSTRSISQMLASRPDFSQLLDSTRSISQMLASRPDFSQILDSTRSISQMLASRPDFSQLLNLSLGFSRELSFGWTSFPDLLIHPKARLAARLGWVVHRTLPRSLLEGTAVADLDQAIMTHYRENWVSVREEIELAASNSPIDQDSKETMSQALTAHEHGLYRLVPPATMTGIERAIRIQLHGGVVGPIDVRESLLGQVDDLPIPVFRDFMSGEIQYETLDEHLYERIRDETDRHPFTESPIPNRHATIHGLVPYSSEKSSLNSIFLLDFVFSLLARIREERIEELTAVLKSHVERQETRQGEDKIIASVRE